MTKPAKAATPKVVSFIVEDIATLSLVRAAGGKIYPSWQAARFHKKEETLAFLVSATCLSHTASTVTLETGKVIGVVAVLDQAQQRTLDQ